MINIFKAKPRASQVLGINERNALYVYAHNCRRHFLLADDKILCKSILQDAGIACAKTYGVIERLGDIPSVWQQVQTHEKLAIKPAKGSGGGGILILKKNALGQWCSGGRAITNGDIHAHFARLLMGMYSFGSSDRVLIEECIIPHPFFHEIYPAGVPDFRIILLHGRPLMAMLRLPTDRSDGKANLHQGGLGIGIDMERGLLKEAYDGQRHHRIHPDSNQSIQGREIPHWTTIKELAVQTAAVFPQLGYLGVDIVLDEALGPLIMEINVRPGLGIQLANKQGLKETIHN